MYSKLASLSPSDCEVLAGLLGCPTGAVDISLNLVFFSCSKTQSSLVLEIFATFGSFLHFNKGRLRYEFGRKDFTHATQKRNVFSFRDT